MIDCVNGLISIHKNKDFHGSIQPKNIFICLDVSVHLYKYLFFNIFFWKIFLFRMKIKKLLKLEIF